MNNSDGSTPFKLFIYVLLIAATVVLAVFPHVFQTTTLWYKLGTDRTLLLAGQTAGLFAAFLIVIQIVLMARLPILVRTFSLKNLNRLHQLNGKAILILALLHVLFVLLPEGLDNLPFGMKFWPEMVGMVLLLTVAALWFSVWARMKFSLSYKGWKFVHRVLGLGGLFLVVVHILFVSDAFAAVSVKVAVLLLAAAGLGIFLLGKMKK